MSVKVSIKSPEVVPRLEMVISPPTMCLAQAPAPQNNSSTHVIKHFMKMDLRFYHNVVRKICAKIVFNTQEG